MLIIRRIIVFIGLLLWVLPVFSQKNEIDTAALRAWPKINQYGISNDGNCMYYIVHSDNSGDSLLIMNLNRTHIVKISNIIGECKFTADSRNLIFNSLVDTSIGILNLVNYNIKYIKGAYTDINQISNGNDGHWITYTKEKQKKELFFFDLNTEKEKYFENVEQYNLSDNGHYAWVKLRYNDTAQLVLLNLIQGTSRIICKSADQSEMTFDQTDSRLAFFSTGLSSGSPSSLICFLPEQDSVITVADMYTPGMDGMRLIEKNIHFSPDGDKLLFYCDNSIIFPNKNPKRPVVNVSILNYMDDSLQLVRAKGPYLSCVNLKAPNHVVQLGQGKDVKENYPEWFNKGHNDDYVLFESNLIGNSTMNYKWRIASRPDVYLVSTFDGHRQLIKRRLIYDELGFSPKGGYVIWYDRQTAEWFTYNIKNQKLNKLFKRDKPRFDRESDYPGLPKAEGIAGWLENDRAVLIYDHFDIWQVDPDGENPPVNITKRYGAKNKIRLRFVDFTDSHPRFMSDKDTLYLTGFNLDNKNTGFYKICLNNSLGVKKLTMQPKMFGFAYKNPPDFSGGRYSMNIVKAAIKKIYLLRTSESSSYPNLFVTSDFRNFRQLTNLQPQIGYNWYSSELIRWNLKNGKSAEGILYKPENFDASKKYPVIFYYYEKNAFALNEYINPETFAGQINIPWMVSRGYLIFVPDINFKFGYPGESAFQTVVSAAIYLSKKSYVDRKHIGLQGHSFGGWETNYILTRSKSLFAAACESSGVSDLVRAYEDFYFPSGYYYELAQGRIGKSIWQKPQWFINNSPIFKANQVKTPLLIKHNKKDIPVPYQQGYQWYQSLVRLGKKVWLLDYQEEGHNLNNEENKVDFTIRTTQFFDHYLKGAQAPKWMTVGIPPEYKDIEDGLDIDTGKKSK